MNMKMRLKHSALAASIALVVSGAAYATDSLTDGLVAYYPFNGDANDESVHDNDGTVNGATLTADRFGNTDSAYHFNGNGNDTHSIELPNTVIDGLTDITSSVWVQTSDASQGLLSGANSGSDNQYSIHIRNGKVFPIIKQQYFSDGLINDGQWHHLVVARDGNSGLVQLFIDANLVGSGTLPTGALSIDVGGLWVGNDQDCVGGCWQPNDDFLGDIDDIRIYNRVLSETEVQELYNLANTSDCDPVIYSSADKKITFDTLAMELYNPITDEPNEQFALFSGADMSLQALPGFYDFQYEGGAPSYAGEIVSESDNCYPTYSAQEETVHFPKVEVPLVAVLPDGSLIDGPATCYNTLFRQSTTQAGVFSLKEVTEIGCE
jgi:hypothetical protein